MSDAKLVGGSEADRAKLLCRFDDYIEANEHFDWRGWRRSGANCPRPRSSTSTATPTTAPTTGAGCGAFYRQNVKGSYWTPFDIGGTITGDMAVIWCQRDTRRNWVGKDQPPRDIHYQGDKFVTRSTMVFHKEGGNWRGCTRIFRKRIAVRGRAASDGG